MNGPCSRDRFCPAMDSRIQGANEHVKGLSTLVVMTLSTGEERLAGVVYKRDSRDRGIVLNYCPWCGADLKWWDKTEAAR